MKKFNEIINRQKYEDTEVKKVILSIYSYYNIFSNRFLDYFFMTIINNLYNVFKYDVSDLIKKRFNPVEDKDMLYNIEESAELAGKRKEIEFRKKAFEEAKLEIMKIS